MDCSIIIKDKTILYSLDDADLFDKWLWRIGTGNYLMRGERRGGRNAKYINIYFHKIVAQRMGLDVNNFFVDHINRNRLDNRRSNLRTATKSQNNSNSEKARSSTGYRGVYPFTKNKNKWYALISVNTKIIRLGSFDSPLEAALAYDKAAIANLGEFAYLNFPIDNLTR